MAPLSRGTLRNGSWIKPSPSPYSPDQVVRWLHAIGYYELVNIPYDNSVAGNTDPSTFPEADLDNLIILARLQLVAFPFESTPIHYSSDHSMDISPQGLYERLVVERNGSCCCGKNGLLLGMLRALGYRVYAGLGRTNALLMLGNPYAPPSFNQLAHMILFVQPLRDSNLTYLVDCGYAVGCLTRPILLSDDEANVVAGATPSEKHRLRREAHPHSSLENPSDDLWRLEVRHEKRGKENLQWKVILTFSETEYHQNDFDSALFFVSSHPQGILATHLICVKFFWMRPQDRDAESEARPVKRVSLKGVDISKMMIGYVSLFGAKLTWKKGAWTAGIREVKTEQERVEVLREVFGISIPQDGLEHIRGRECALPYALN